MRKRVLVLAVVVATFAMLPFGASSGAVPAGQPVGQVVKIGLISPIESPSVSNPLDEITMEAAVEYFNEQGGVGVNGLKLEAVVCNSGADANEEVACAREMVDEGVVATVGDLTFINPSGVVEVLEAAGIPRIGLSAGDAAQFGSTVSYPVSAGPVGEMVTAAVGLAEKGAKTVAVVSVETPTAGALLELITGPFEEAGIEIVGRVPITEGSTDYSSYVGEAQRLDSDAVLIVTGEAQAAQFVAASEQLNAKYTIAGLTPSFSLDTLRGHKALTKKGVFVNSLPYPAPNNAKTFPGLKTFFKAMKASGNPDVAPKKLVPSALRVWMGVLGFVRVTADVETFTNETVVDALETVQNVDMDGLIPPWTPSTPGYSVFAAISNHYVYVMSFNGKNLVTQPEPIEITGFFET